MKNHADDEQQLIDNDPVRKFQINYNNDLYMVPKYPEGMTLDGVCLPISVNNSGHQPNEVDANQIHEIAPGEGKTPINIVYCDDWDAKAFPMLFPDGRNHLFDKNRKRKLRDQDFFCQRLFNVDPRWRKNIHWVFAATGFREKKDFKGNIDLAFKKGKKHMTSQGSLKYHLENPYSVFQGVLNTPAYHKKGKFETMARLDNHGPFNIFFTLSCADYRWPENVAAILREQGIGLRCTLSSGVETEYEVWNNDKWVPLNLYISDEMDESVHNLFRNNVVTATRVYEQKVKSIMQNIICSKTNPLSVEHYTLKLEFAGRGAGHNHGVLWLDIPRIERKVDIYRLKIIISKSDYSTTKVSLTNPEDCKEILNDYLISRRLGIDPKPDKYGDHRSFRYLHKLNKKSLEKTIEVHEQVILDELKSIYPLYGLRNALKALNDTEEHPSDEELSTIVNFVDIFSTVSINPAIVGKNVSTIATEVNQHKHTKTCRKYMTTCRFNFPKLPSYKTVIARPADKSCTQEEKSALEKKYNKILKKVKECLDKKNIMDDILVKYPKQEEQTVSQAIEGRRQRINALLDMAGLVSDEDKQQYQKALEFSCAGYSIIYARDIDEVWVNSFNPEITRAWNGNTDFQIVLDYYAIITYIFEYFTKDDTGVLQILITTLKATENKDLKDQMILLMNTWIKNRQMGEAEAVFRLIPHFKFRQSDSKCVFVQTCPRNERSKILKNATDKIEYQKLPKVFVENDEREYIEQYDIHSKYERRPIESVPILKHVSFSQFIKMYEPWWGKSLDNDDEENNQEDLDIETNLVVVDSQKRYNESKNEAYLEFNLKDDEDFVHPNNKFFQTIACCFEHGHGPSLPSHFELNDPYPGEPFFMKLRQKPAVLRFHKIKQEKDPEGFWFSEAMLYIPHDNEENLNNDVMEAKKSEEKWESFVYRISYVKSQVMEHLAENELARLMAEEMIANNTMTGENINPEVEQELEDNRLEVYAQIPDLEHLDPDTFENKQSKDQREKSFKPIKVRPLESLKEIAAKLDFYQSKILEITIKHARNLVKSRSRNCQVPKPPLLMVDGAAGSGKSHVISTIREFIQLIMQLPGDDPECPYIMVCAPTGSAAVNVNGVTLHSAFGFTFGNEHFSLPDKTRDTKRNIYKNLKFLIIDEISMVKADQLYQLDLRLREITMKPNDLFGGVSVLLFGDIMQLRPVMGRYIWSQPQNEAFLHAYIVQPHWEQFDVISLEENHRQQEDGHFADIMNRIRVGKHTEDDLNVLEERVRPENHSDLKEALVIACKHKDVHKHNELCLDQIENDLFTIKAVNTHPNIVNYKPKIEKRKLTVGNTPYLETLHVKVGCRVMLTVNLDVNDGLCNGSIGTIEAILLNSHNEITTLMVKFDDPNAGRELRNENLQLKAKYPEYTPIKKQIHKYSTSKSLKGERLNVAIVQQFPLILSFALTCHKIQGITVKSPRKVAVDLRTVWGASQAYVMLGRVQKLDQLFIIGALPRSKIYCDKFALDELSKMKQRSLNENPQVWEQKSHQHLKIAYHNIHSLQNKIDDVQSDKILAFSDVLIFGETWLPESVDTVILANFKDHLNSWGRGKGLAIYYKEDEATVQKLYTDKHLQISAVLNSTIEILGFYRSADDDNFISALTSWIQPVKSYLLIGDMNICSKTYPDHKVFKALGNLGFKLISNQSTHILGGYIDQVWIKPQTEDCSDYSISLYSPVYNCTDHDAILVSFKKQFQGESVGNIVSMYIQNVIDIYFQVLKRARDLGALHQLQQS